MAFLEVTQPSSSLLTLSQAVSGGATLPCPCPLPCPQRALCPLAPAGSGAFRPRTST